MSQEKNKHTKTAPLIKVAPSLLSADFGKLAEESKRAAAAGADALHLDVMDGHFVPNLTMGPRTVAAVNRATDLFLDVHLMVYHPYDYVERFVEAGADRITIHFEATENVEETLLYIKKCGIEAGLAFCPETSESFIPKYLDKCDLILLMTVSPGFGGQSFMPEVLSKVAFTSDLCKRFEVKKKGTSVPIEIQVDGGINQETGKLCVEAGATLLVSGSYLFGVPEMSQAISDLKGLKTQ